MAMSDQKHDPPCPKQWAGYVSTLVGPCTLKVAGYSLVVDITEKQLTHLYFPLLAMLDHLQQTSKKRVVAGIAGIPGSGKSTFAAVLTDVAGVLFDRKRLITVGMDGWHLNNAILNKKTITDQTGEKVPLRLHKGAPQSFDVQALADAINKIKQTQAAVKLPVYDRRIHDPIPDAIALGPETKIVLIEGNYLLCDMSGWDKISSQLQPKLFLECDHNTARQRVIARHIRGGLDRQSADAKYELNDRTNTEIVLKYTLPQHINIKIEPQPAIQQNNC